MANSQFNQSNESKDEAAPTWLPPSVANIVTNLLSGNIDTNFAGDKDTKSFTADERQRFRLFGKPIEKVLTDKFTHPDPEATVIANLILRAEEKDVNEALELIAKKLQQNSSYLEYAVIATDPLKRPVKGTLLQLAAMAGDVDLKADIKDDKEHGLVEQIATIGKLSFKEVALQLQVITSKEAQEANEKRNQRILNAITKFGEGLIQKVSEYKGKDELKEFQNFCKPLIDELEKALTPDLKEVTTLGFIFDTAILYQAAIWFAKNVTRFKGWWSIQSDVFWVNGFGKLQSKLSSRDAQITNAGWGLFEDGVVPSVPSRTLNNSSGSSYFFNSSSRLGGDFYLGYYHWVRGGRRVWGGVQWLGEHRRLESLCRTKTSALRNLCSSQETSIRQNRVGG